MPLLLSVSNAYTKEDPLKVLTDAGWAHESGHGDSSYVYSGRSGSMDHVFANSAAHPLITEVKSWAVNAQESIAFEYSRANYNAYLAFEAGNPYRASDHNPEIIGLNLITPINNPSVAPTGEPSGQASTSPNAPTQPTPQSAATPKHSALASTGVMGSIPLIAGAFALAAIGCALRRKTL